MFLRLVRATVSKGVKREYVRVVEAYRDASGKNSSPHDHQSRPPGFVGEAS